MRSMVKAVVAASAVALLGSCSVLGMSTRPDGDMISAVSTALEDELADVSEYCVSYRWNAPVLTVSTAPEYEEIVREAVETIRADAAEEYGVELALGVEPGMCETGGA